jgi:hypothetical protein
MASRKIHITNEVELLRAMRSTGYCFPTNLIEQRMSLKLKSEIDIQSLANQIDPNQIWEAEDPKPYKIGAMRSFDSDPMLLEQWGIAAKGNANISKEIMDKIKKNQEGNGK